MDAGSLQTKREISHSAGGISTEDWGSLRYPLRQEYKFPALIYCVQFGVFATMCRMSDTISQPDKALCAEAAGACVCFNLRKASRAVTKLFDEALQPLGLRSTQFVTLLIVHVHQPISLPGLAKELVIDRSTLVRNLAVLQKRGLLDSSSPNGKRSRVFQLTDDGVRALTEGIPLWEKAQSRFLTQFGPEKWADTLSVLSETVETAQHL